jgi:putative Holliday junction resolvase
MMGLDVGERRIGVAVSEGRIAVPLTIVEHRSRDADIARLVDIAREQHVAAVIVGLPVSLSGEEHGQAQRTRRFGDTLAQRLDVPVVYHDERYSTVQVAALAEQRPPAKRRGKTHVDDLAAAVILQSYIDAQERPE